MDPTTISCCRTISLGFLLSIYINLQKNIVIFLISIIILWKGLVFSIQGYWIHSFVKRAQSAASGVCFFVWLFELGKGLQILSLNFVFHHRENSNPFIYLDQQWKLNDSMIGEFRMNLKRNINHKTRTPHLGLATHVKTDPPRCANSSSSTGNVTERD